VCKIIEIVFLVFLANTSNMHIRTAKPTDISQIQFVRNAVTENTLSDPALVSDADCLKFITQRGKGWVCEIDQTIVGFAIVDMQESNIWALFLHPDYEKRGIGRQLHDTMLDWYFGQTDQTIWLGTSPKTRAEAFYIKAGWTEIGMHCHNEIKFEMTKNVWESRTGGSALASASERR
jgi:GNAT superfamily N-acetyltransferase